jgi:ABC-type sugar transport system substrate-binding protein
MKKRFVCLVLVLIFCLLFSGTAFAAKTGEVTPMSTVGLSSGLTHISGTSYRPWASATAALPEDVTVGFTLYKLVNGSYTSVTSGSASANGTYVLAKKTATLSSGSYKLYSWYIGETQSGSSNKYYTI